MNNKSINSPPRNGGAPAQLASLHRGRRNAQRAEGGRGSVEDIVTEKMADPRYKVLILLPDWQEELFEALMSDVNKAVYSEVWHLLRGKLFKIRNKLFNPIARNSPEGTT